MKKTFEELPGWIFEMEEVSAGVYEVTGTDSYGRRVQSKGTDLDRLVDECREYASRLLHQR